MKNTYNIRVECSNPEFQDSELRKGINADGYVLLIVRDGEPCLENMGGVTVMEIARFFGTDTEACSVLRQASAIGDGLRRAREIREETENRKRRDRIAKEIAGKIIGVNLTGKDED